MKPTPGSKMEVDGYRRVSLEEQAQSGLSLEHQEEKIRLYCELHDLTLVNMFSDPGESGKSLDRPGAQAALRNLRKKRVDGLVIFKLDRLTRSLRDWVGLIEGLFSGRKARRLFSVSESIDTDKAAGRMVLNMMMTVYQWEREVIGERTSEVLQSKIRRGERCGKIRYGYRLADDGKTLLPVEDEQEVIRRMQAWKDRGYSYREMVKALEDLGIETKDGCRLWLPATVHRILTRPIA